MNMSAALSFPSSTIVASWARLMRMSLWSPRADWIFLATAPIARYFFFVQRLGRIDAVAQPLCAFTDRVQLFLPLVRAFGEAGEFGLGLADVLAALRDRLVDDVGCGGEFRVGSRRGGEARRASTE